MKKLLLALTFLVFAIGLPILKAQTLTIEKEYHNVVFPASEFSDASTYLQNNSAGPIKIKWTRMVEYEPVGWTTTVCDALNCYSPSTAVAPLVVTIPAGETSLLKLNLFPNEVVGVAKYYIVAYDITDSAGVNVTMTVDATAQETTGIGDAASKDVISIYPNPAKDVLTVNLDAARQISSIEIYNVVGQKMKTVNLQEGIKSVAVPVSDLKKGVYFVRVLSGDKEVATKTFSKD